MTTIAQYTQQIDGFEQHYQYDVTYMRELLQSSVTAYERFSQSSALSMHREWLSKEQHWVCKLVAMQVEDCGACLQLTIDMAIEDGIEVDFVRQLLDNGTSLTSEQRDLRNYVEDVAANQHNHPDSVERVLKRYEKKQLLEMGLAIASVKLYPSIKRALGYAKSCQLMTLRIAS